MLKFNNEPVGSNTLSSLSKDFTGQKDMHKELFGDSFPIFLKYICLRTSKSESFVFFKNYQTKNQLEEFGNIQFDTDTFVFLGTTANGCMVKHSL